MPLDRRRRALAAALVFLVTLVAMEALAVITILPHVKDDLGGLAWYAWVISAFQLAQIAGIPVTGRLLDRTNPAVPLIIGIVAFGSGLAVGALAPSMPVLVIGRALQGFGAGAIPAVAYVCVGRGFEEEQRPRIFALMSSASVIPAVASPALASVVYRFFGWRWVFGGLIPLTIIAGGLAVPAVRALGRAEVDPMAEAVDPETNEGRGTIGPSLILVIGATAVIGGFGLRQPAPAIAIGLIGVVVTTLAFRRLTPEGSLRAVPGVPATVLVRGVLTFSFFATDTFVSLMLEKVRGTGNLYAAVAYAAASFTWTAGSWIQARSSRTHSAAFLNRIGLLVVGVGSGMMALVVMTSVPTWTAVIAWGVGGLGIGLAYPQQALVVLNTSAPGREGFSTAALQLSDVLGVAIGSGVGGVIITTSNRWHDGLNHGLAIVFLMSVGVAVIGVALAGRLPHRPMAATGPTDPTDPTQSMSEADEADEAMSSAQAVAVTAATIGETGRQGI
jgi:MFS family permease